MKNKIPDFDAMSEEEYMAWVKKQEAKETRKKNNDIKKFLKSEFKKASDFRVLSQVDVLWAGWECDPTIWLCQVDDKKVLVATDHGAYTLAAKELLEIKGKEYIKLATIYFNWLDQIVNGNKAEKLIKGDY